MQLPSSEMPNTISSIQKNNIQAFFSEHQVAMG